MLPPSRCLLVTGHTERAWRSSSAHLSRSQPLLTYFVEEYVRVWWTFLEGDSIPSGKSSPPPPDVELYLDVFQYSCAGQPLVACATVLARVRRLEIQPLSSIACAGDLHGVFKYTPGLRVLLVSCHPQGGVLEGPASRRRRAASVSRTGTGTCEEDALPELKVHTVQMSNVRLGCARAEHERVYPEEMVNSLMARRSEGTPIAMLELKNCFNTELGDVNRLREVVDVADVVWDGPETWEDDEAEGGYGP